MILYALSGLCIFWFLLSIAATYVAGGDKNYDANICCFFVWLHFFVLTGLTIGLWLT